MKHSHYLYAIAVAAMLQGCGGSVNREDNQPVHNVFVTSPTPVGAGSERILAAVVEEARTISVGFKTAGQIERIMVKEGDRVRRGQLIAVLDTVDYALGVNQLRDQYARQADEFKRQTQLHAGGNMSENDYLKAASGLRQLGLQLELNENKLRYCRLTAPTDGIITKVGFEPSEMVDAGTPVVELMDNSMLEVAVDLPVGEYMRREKFAAFAGLLPDGSRVPLGLLSITPRADNNQLYRMKLSLPHTAADAVTPGMNISVAIAVDGCEGGDMACTVPARAVFDRDGMRCVWVMSPADSTVTARPVTTDGTVHDGLITVTDGLTPGDIIVRAGVRALNAGEKVHVIEPASATNAGNVL